MLVIKRGATEVDEPDVGSLHAPHVPPLEKKELFWNTLEWQLILHTESKLESLKMSNGQALQTTAYLFTVVCTIVIRINEQDVLRFKICVRKLIVVQELYSVTKLVAHMPDMFQRVRLITVISL